MLFAIWYQPAAHLKSNGLVPFADVMSSEAVLIGSKGSENDRFGAGIDTTYPIGIACQRN
jgi:hypothetical protein